MVSRAQVGASLALCLEIPKAKLHPEVAWGNAGLKLGLTEGALGHTRLSSSHSLQEKEGSS